MKLAIITDIHEDFANLEKAFKAIDQHGCDAVICLGDITGYSPVFYGHNPDANACLDLIRSKADFVIAGNHDLFTAGRLPSYHASKRIPENWYQLNLADRIRISKNKIWLYLDEIVPELNNENLQFLQGIKEWEIIEANGQKYLFTHFFRPDMLGIGRWFPFNNLEIQDHFRFMKEFGCKNSFVGHAHPQGLVAVNRWFWADPTEKDLTIKKYHKAFICPAIVGERYQSSFTIFDTVNSNLKIIPII
jgi:predicted phosphodiesterase